MIIETESTGTIGTNEIDLAASYFVTFGEMPPFFYSDNSGIATFELKDSDDTRSLFIEYMTGTLELNIRRFTACRARLYKALREARR